MAHPTAEPVEILITRPPQKIKSREPTHQNHPHRGYFKYILGAQAPWFYPGAPKGGTSKPPSASMHVRKRCKRHWINFLAFWLVLDFGWFWRARKIDPYLHIPLKIVLCSSNFPILFSDFHPKNPETLQLLQDLHGGLLEVPCQSGVLGQDHLLVPDNLGV